MQEGWHVLACQCTSFHKAVVQLRILQAKNYHRVFCCNGLVHFWILIPTRGVSEHPFSYLCTSTSPPIYLVPFPVSTLNLCAPSLAHLNCIGFPYDLHMLTSSCCRHWEDASLLVGKCSHFITNHRQLF